jgi:hypothetical protein
LNESIASTSGPSSGIKASNELLVFPNPTNGVTTISLTKSSRYEVRLFDLIGNSIYKSEFQGDTYQLSIDNLNAGTYLIQIMDQMNGQSKISKLIKR